MTEEKYCPNCKTKVVAISKCIGEGWETNCSQCDELLDED